MKRYRFLVALAVCGLAFGQLSAFQHTLEKSNPAEVQRMLEREVRHELVMLPYYGVFDALKFQVQGRKVILLGAVTRPTLKKDAESAVKNVEGVESVDNQIEVLPLSPGDDRIRRTTYRAIYGHTALARYGVRAVPPIHIIVKNGNITLDGVVATEGDKNIAGIQAKSVPGAFQVTNNLLVEKGGGKTEKAE